MDILKEEEGWAFVEWSEEEIGESLGKVTRPPIEVDGIRFIHMKCFHFVEREGLAPNSYSCGVTASLYWSRAAKREAFKCNSCDAVAPSWVEHMYEFLTLGASRGRS